VFQVEASTPAYSDRALSHVHYADNEEFPFKAQPRISPSINRGERKYEGKRGGA